MNPRPTKKPEDKQVASMRIGCTKEELAEVKALAKEHGISQYTVYVRLAALGIIQVDRSKIEKKKKK